MELATGRRRSSSISGQDPGLLRQATATEGIPLPALTYLVEEAENDEGVGQSLAQVMPESGRLDVHGIFAEESRSSLDLTLSR